MILAFRRFSCEAGDVQMSLLAFCTCIEVCCHRVVIDFFCDLLGALWTAWQGRQVMTPGRPYIMPEKTTPPFGNGHYLTGEKVQQQDLLGQQDSLDFRGAPFASDPIRPSVSTVCGLSESLSGSLGIMRETRLDERSAYK